MAIVPKANTFTSGTTISSTDVNKNFDDLYNDYNGNITNDNISDSAAITDTKLAQITTANKVASTAITDGALNVAAVTCDSVSVAANGGVHLTEGTAPSTAASAGALYTKDTSGQPELFFREESDGDEVQITSGGVLSSGKVLQVVYSQELTTDSTTTLIPLDNSKPQGGTDGKEVLNLAITPTSASSTLKIDVVVNLGHSVAGARVAAFLWRDATADALACAMQEITTTTGFQTIAFTFFQESTNTDARTFRVSVGSNTDGTTHVNNSETANIYGNTLASSITITEMVI